MSKLKVDYISIEELIPYINNSRTHSDEQVAQIASSIKEFGFTNPVLIDVDGGIIAGHGRVLAARRLKLDQVPVIVLAGLSEAQKKAYIIADNKLALNAGWDEELLAIEIEELKRLDYEVELIGFNDNELIDLLPDLFNDNSDDDMNDNDDEFEDTFINDEQKYLLLIEYDNESQLEQGYNETIERGFKCKIIE